MLPDFFIGAHAAVSGYALVSRDKGRFSTYFAKPYHSWERGLNENHNGLLRQYFPKAKPLDQVTQADVIKALAGLNHRPKKTLNYKTPWEVFCKMAGLDTDNLLGVAFMG